MSEILIGPLLRYVSETEATVWVETDEACEVEVLGHSERTFGVAGHHYALVRIEGLEPGGFYEYEVALDGERRWPAEGSELPPSAIRTLGSGKPLDICFGSCRVALPHEHPYTEAADEHEEGFELDALHVLARQMIRDDRDDWPELLFLLGDQVYVDEGSPQRASGSGPSGTRASRPGRRSSTSRSTPGSTASPGGTRWSAGCSRPSRRRWSGTTTT